MLTSVAPPRPRALPDSIRKCKAVALPKAENLQSTYQWTPVQKNRSEGPVNRRGGVFVTTLCVDFLTQTFEGATPFMVRVEKANFAAVQGGAVWCYLVGGICVILKGVVTGRRSSAGYSARSNLIARLPEGLRPTRPLLFAALARDVFEDGGRTVISSSRATIMVTPDGDITKIGGGSPEASIDLSAIRFCTDRGISLVDEVSVHAVDVAGSRLVTLQGVLLERSWQTGKKQLATLPESCRPSGDLNFIVPGMSREGYHLVHVRPTAAAGSAGEIMWKDSIWIRDRINLTGVMFEVSQDVLNLRLHKTDEEMEVARQALMQDLHRRIVKKYGDCRKGLKKAFSLKESEELNFTQFVAGTKLLGYPGHMTRLWSMLDEDQGGSVSYEELESAIYSGLFIEEADQKPQLPHASTTDMVPLDVTARMPLSARACLEPLNLALKA